MRPDDRVRGEPPEPGLFELWMGMPAEAWDALGPGEDNDVDEREGRR